MSRRRIFLALLGMAPLVSLPALAQTRPIPKIGVLWHAATPEDEAVYAEPLKKSFSDLGYVENRDLIFIETYASEQYEKFIVNAAQLVKSNVGVIIAVTGPAATAAQRATTTIPIVFLIVPDPVGRNFAKSLSRLGGNLTGLSTAAVDLSSKRLEQLKAAIPGLTRVGLFVNAKDPPMSHAVEERTRSAATALNVAVEVTRIEAPQELNSAFTRVRSSEIPAVVFMQDPLFFNERQQIAKLGLSHGVATMVANGLMVCEGCLISYGPNFPAQFRRVASFVDKILKGQSPSEIPMRSLHALNLS
ncbi:ABC transporter substrate-binding protein [Methylobacterium crusticola]|nr:ABC transporter substrate-binding protein [Methylobacterium crusticola]